jgi:hypothetical protein
VTAAQRTQARRFGSRFPTRAACRCYLARQRQRATAQWRSRASRTLDESHVLGLFGKLKLVICARPELRAGFFIPGAIDRNSACGSRHKAPFRSLRRLHGSAPFITVVLCIRPVLSVARRVEPCIFVGHPRPRDAPRSGCGAFCPARWHDPGKCGKQ